MTSSTNGKKRSSWRLLLLVPFIATLWVPFYNRVEPTFIGIPFFYWYLLLWAPLSALITWIVFSRNDSPDNDR